MPALRRPRTSNVVESFRKAGVASRLALVFASCFGIGLIPAAPGTFAALAALPFASALARLSPVPGACVLLLCILLAVWASARSARALQKEDPAEVVIDEAVGLFLTLFLLPASEFNLCLGFVLFRLFDIVKPYPISRLERIGGGVGIVLDDLLAGLYGNLCLRLLGSIIS